MKSNLISVIIPTSNSERYIHRTLKSLLNQTYKNFEIIIIDNSSTDKTIQKIIKFKDKLNINILNILNKGIIASSRNLGIQNANGDIISFLDSDDYWHKDKLKITNIYFQKNVIDLFCHNEVHLIKDKCKYKKMNFNFYKKNTYNRLLLYGNCLSTSAVSVRSNFIKKNKFYFSEKSDYKSAEDYDFWLLLAKNQANFIFTNQFLGYCQFNTESYSNSDIFIHHQRVNNVIYDHLKNLKNKKMVNLIKSRIKLTEIKLILNNFNLIKALQVLFRLKLNEYLYIILFLVIKFTRGIY